MTTLLLAGIAVGSFMAAVTHFLMLISNNDNLRQIFWWLQGGFSLGNWEQVAAVTPYALVGISIVLLCARQLNVLQLGEEQAQQLGVEVERYRLVLVAGASLMTAAAVSVGGIIGFVGLIIPHAVRLVWGPDYRFLLPMATVLGSIFLVLADMLSRTVFAPNEMPVGIVTAFFGAPFFLYLLMQRKRMVS